MKFDSISCQFGPINFPDTNLRKVLDTVSFFPESLNNFFIICAIVGPENITDFRFFSNSCRCGDIFNTCDIFCLCVPPKLLYAAPLNDSFMVFSTMTFERYSRFYIFVFKTKLLKTRITWKRHEALTCIELF